MFDDLETVESHPADCQCMQCTVSTALYVDNA